MNRKKILILLLILLIIVAISLYVVIILLPPPPPPPLHITPYLDFTTLESGVLDCGIRKPTSPVIESKKVVYLLSRLNGKDITDVYANVQLFGDEVPRDIYLLDYSSAGVPGCTECEGINDFKVSLEKTLKKYGLIDVNSTLNQIKIHQLDKLTHRSILIVPTGKIPSQLIGLESGPNIGSLMDEGSVIIFLGSDLSESLNRDGSVSQISNSQLSLFNISYRKRSDLITYPPYNLKKPAFSASSDIVYGSMSIVRKGLGYFFVLPRSIDIGWSRNGTQAGEEVGRLIYEVAWQRPLTAGELTIPLSRIREAGSNRSMLFLNASLYDAGWARVYLITNATNKTPFYAVFDQRITPSVNGTMKHMCGAARGENEFTIEFNLVVNFTKPKDVNISVGIYDENLVLINRQRAQRNIRLTIGEYSFSSNFVIDFPSGNYTLRAEDEEGFVYAQSLLNVPPIIVMEQQASWDSEPQIILFKVQLPANPLIEEKEPQPLQYRWVNVTVNSSPYADLFREPFVAITDLNGMFNYSPPLGSALAYGNYTFKVNVSGEMVYVNIKRTKPPNLFDNPINVAIIIIAILVGIAGYALRRPEKPIYTIDVPDFAPLEKVVVPISKFSILSLFDSVNKEYKWSFMPLSAQELKNEMRRKITHKGVPILITDYNLEKVLNELIESGDIVKALNFYGLKTWEKKSGRSMRYLALFRLLRNFFINNAIPFTDLNERMDCDMLTTAKGENIYIHIYTDEGTFRRALELTGSGKNFIVFESKRELEEILKKLDLSYSPVAVILKSEIGSGGINFIHPGMFGIMLGK